MKTVNFFYCLVISFLCIQCSSDDNLASLNNDTLEPTSQPPIEDTSVGNWIVSYIGIGDGKLTSDDNSIDWGWVFYTYPIPVVGEIESHNYEINSKNNDVISYKGIIDLKYTAIINDYISSYEYSKTMENIELFFDINRNFENTFFVNENNNQNGGFYIDEQSENQFVVAKNINDEFLYNAYSDLEPLKLEANFKIYMSFRKQR